MATTANNFLTLHQCLCGYNDGHKLLASSRKIPNSAMPLLLSYSDIPPGLTTGNFKSYWTGIPLLPIKSYALMHTWPASELPRPGCVWTHILLIEFADLHKISALDSLRHLFARPCSQDRHTRYETPYVINIQDITDSNTILDITDSEILPILESLYSSKATGYVYHNQHVEDIIFAIWSQQWAKLKRSFSFRTSYGAAVGSSSLQQKFDLFVLPGDNNAQSTITVLEPWKQVAIDDILGKPSDFRQFLWKYGTDMQRGKERFSFLANLYFDTRTDYLSNIALENILDNIVERLPQLNDGKILKEDLLFNINSTSSFMPSSDQLDILYYFACGRDKDALPKNFKISKETINKDWVSKTCRLLSIAEQSLLNRNIFSTNIVEVLSSIANKDTFLSESKNYPLAREQVIKLTPSLLNSEYITDIHQPDLNILIGYIDTEELLIEILEHLSKLNDKAVVECIATMSSSVLCSYIFKHTTSSILGEKQPLPKVWIHVAKKYLSNRIFMEWLEQATTSAELTAIIILLDENIVRGLMLGTNLWCSAVQRMRYNTSRREFQLVQAYLLALALVKPARGCEILFELTFESIHRDLKNSYLPYEFFKLFENYLPSLFLWRQWDKCLRLRLAVVKAYVGNALNPQSFCRLTEDTNLHQQLVELAEETERGKRFLQDRT